MKYLKFFENVEDDLIDKSMDELDKFVKKFFLEEYGYKIESKIHKSKWLYSYIKFGYRDVYDDLLIFFTFDIHYDDDFYKIGLDFLYTEYEFQKYVDVFSSYLISLIKELITYSKQVIGGKVLYFIKPENLEYLISVSNFDYYEARKNSQKYNI